MNFFERLKFQRARFAFNRRREEFYADLAEAFKDGENIPTYLSQVRKALRDRGLDDAAGLYTTMIARLNEEEGKIAHMLAPIVPRSDLLALAANDSAVSKDVKVSGYELLGRTITNSRKLTRSVFKAIAGPLFVTPIIVAFVLFVSFFFVPEYEKQLSHERWSTHGQMLYWISFGVRYYGLGLVAALISGLIVFYRSFGAWHGKTRAKVDDFLPYKLYRDYVSANFLIVLALLLHTQTDFVKAMEKLRANASPWLAWHIRTIITNLDRYPDDPSKAFDTGLLSPELHQRLATYSRRASFKDGLIRIGTDGVAHVQATVDRSTGVLYTVAVTAVISALMFLYIGNLAISNSVRAVITEEVDSYVR